MRRRSPKERKAMFANMGRRTPQALNRDNSIRAANTLPDTPANRDIWATNPRRIDIEGLDTPLIPGKTINKIESNSSVGQDKPEEKTTMKFKDNNKEYSIEFEEIHNRFNGAVQGGFILHVTKPFKASNRFVEGDVKTLRGTDGINFYKSSKIAKAVNAKDDVLFSLNDDALTHIKNEAQKGKQKIEKTANDKTIKTWVWAIGGDTHNLYMNTDDLNSLEMHFRDDLREIRGYIEKNQSRVMDSMQEYSHDIKHRDTALYTDKWYEIPNKEVMKIYADLKKQDADAQAIKKDKVQAILDKAAETGERQIISQWPVECTDSDEDCSLDIMTKYAMPDGTIKNEHQHTW